VQQKRFTSKEASKTGERARNNTRVDTIFGQVPPTLALQKKKKNVFFFVK
jgi:hypothetical protein